MSVPLLLLTRKTVIRKTVIRRDRRPSIGAGIAIWLAASALVVARVASAAADMPGTATQDSILGAWINPKKTVVVQMAPCGDRVPDNSLCGTIIWLAKPYRKNGELKRADGVPWCGLNIVRGFSYAGGNSWSGGSVYDPSDDKTYKGSMTLVDQDTLHIRGYVLLPLLGRTMIWQRVATPSSPCPQQ